MKPVFIAKLFLIVVCMHSRAYAADIIINTPTAASQILAATDTVTITNTGSITGLGWAINANGVIAGFVDNDGLVTGSTGGVLSVFGADYAGGIVNRAGAAIDGALYGAATALGADFSGGFDNSGTVSGSVIGIWNVFNGLFSGTLINRNGGLITGATGVQVEASSQTGGIVNSGGIIEGTGGTAINFIGLTGMAPLTLDGGRVIGDVQDDTPSNNFSPVTIAGDFTTEGNFVVSNLTINAGALFTVSPGNTVTLNNMPAGTGGGLVIGVDNSGIGGAGMLVVNGAGQGLNLTGTSISVDVGAGALTAGDEILIGNGAVSIMGGAGGARVQVQDNSFSFNFEIADGTSATVPTDDSELFLFVVPGSTCTGSTSTSGNAHACTVMRSLDPSAEPLLQQAIVNMNSAGNDIDLNEILESVQPAVDGGVVMNSFDVLDKTLNLVSRRFVEPKINSGTGISSGNITTDIDRFIGEASETTKGKNQGPKSSHVWGEAFGFHANQGTRGGINGYNANSAGIVMGFDTEKSEGKVLGAAFSYSKSHIQSENANASEADTSSYQLTIYGGLNTGKTSYLRAMGAYVFNDIENQRYNVGGIGGPTASARYSANQYSLRATAGKHFRLDDTTTLTTNLLTHWMHYDPVDYSETGAGGASLTVRPEDLNVLELGLGTSISWSIPNDDGSSLTPEVTAGYRYDFIGNRIETNSTFSGGGAVVTSLGPSPDQHKFNLGTSILYSSTEDWNLALGYEFEYKDEYLSHAARLKAVIKF